jgi:hypothetical protein
MELAPDETLYYAEIAGQDVMRSINADSAEPTPGVTFAAMGPTTANGAALDVAAGASNYVLLLETTPTIRIYTDTLARAAVGVSLVAPADGYVASGTTTAVNVTFTVTLPDQVTTVTVSIADNTDFSDQDTTNTIVAPAVSTTVNILGLGFSTEGKTIYWRARASAPFTGPWSEVRSFSMPVVTAVQAPVPQYPAGDDVMNVPITPILNWSAFKAATGYQVQLSTSSDMSSPMIDETLGKITSYKVVTPLDYDSTYYWRVRAQVGASTGYSDWSAIVGFTTMSKPVAPAPPVVIEPTPPPTVEVTEITPAYIWAIIAIGAVLVIVVVVLIVRTRRP